jgi:hypothetical protein
VLLLFSSTKRFVMTVCYNSVFHKCYTHALLIISLARHLSTQRALYKLHTIPVKQKFYSHLIKAWSPCNWESVNKKCHDVWILYCCNTVHTLYWMPLKKYHIISTLTHFQIHILLWWHWADSSFEWLIKKVFYMSVLYFFLARNHRKP